MTRKVTLIEINVFDKMVPLVSGYLQAYACKDTEVRETYDFQKYTTTTKTHFLEIVHELTRHKSDLYAFSCYLWNMNLIKKLLPPLLQMNPNAHFLLGGPQVMHHADQYLDPEHERLLLCNGEGEKTFTSFLRELTQETPDFSRVRGLSFYRDGAIVTTEPEERIRDLNEIPSPFLNGLFDDGAYQMTILETNRGCPFHCGFCFWGAATNDRVARFSEDRIREEVTWIGRNSVASIFIADANWGILKRDIDLSTHIAESKQQYGLPVWVFFSAAKNSPQRVAQITEIFTENGLLNLQPISMQSLDETSLAYVDRTNIKLNAFETLQEDLNERGISSYIELIWPLPGETLASFKKGIETLFERRAAVIVVYPHLLLHNTPIYKRQEEYELVTRPVEDGAAEAELVVGTADVSPADFEDGMWFYYTVLALYNTRSIPGLSRYLHTNGLMSFSDLYSDFIDFCKNRPDHPFSQFCITSIEEADYYDINNYPMVYHIMLHAEREASDAILYEFASAQTWWEDEQARVLFEIDLLNKPYLYSNTPIEKPLYPLEFIRILDTGSQSCHVEVPARYLPLLDQTVNRKISVQNGSADSYRFRLDHNKGQYPFMPEKSRRDNADYCYGMITRSAKILPDWIGA